MCGLYCHLFFVVLLLVLGERIAGRLGWNVVILFPCDQRRDLRIALEPIVLK